MRGRAIYRERGRREREGDCAYGRVVGRELAHVVVDEPEQNTARGEILPLPERQTYKEDRDVQIKYTDRDRVRTSGAPMRMYW
jgi:hypothetical protein